MNNYAGAQIKLILINLNGEVLQQESMAIKSSELNYQFNVNKNIPMGQYLLNIKGDGLDETFKIFRKEN